MQFWTTCAVACVAFASNVLSQTITQDTVEISPVDLQIGDLTIQLIRMFTTRL